MNSFSRKFSLVLSALALVFFLVPQAFAKTMEERANDSAAQTTLGGTPLAYKEVGRNTVERAAIKRNHLDVVIVPTGDQSQATQADLAATVMQAAMATQNETGLPVVTVNMLCQNTGDSYADMQLALATYIPDGKGFSGNDVTPVWETVMVAGRGFTEQELQYLRLWGEMRGQYQKDGRTDDDSLDNAIHKIMGLESGTLKPHYNPMSNKLEIQ